MHTEKVNSDVLIYLNRLSDFLFVLARATNDGGKTDVLWVPGRIGCETIRFVGLASGRSRWISVFHDRALTV